MSSGESLDQTKGQSGIFRAALLGSCPRCKEPTLFEAPARLSLKCSSCELDLGALEGGGRLSGLLTAFVAVVLILIAVGVNTLFAPPLWLQAAFWAPVTVFGVVGVLRLFKTLLLYANFERQKEGME